MPFYEYDCPSCGEVVEVLQKMNEPPPETCPSCGGAGPLHKRMSVAGIQVRSAAAAAPCGIGGEPACGAGACPACLPD